MIRIRRLYVVVKQE